MPGQGQQQPGLVPGLVLVLVRRGCPIRVRVTEGIRNDCAYLVHGFGQQSKALRRAFGRGASDNSLMSRVSVDPLTGGTGMRVNFVRAARA